MAFPPHTSPLLTSFLCRHGARSLQWFFNGGRLMSEHGPVHANSKPLPPPPSPSPCGLESPFFFFFFPNTPSSCFSPQPPTLVRAVVTEGVSLLPAPQSPQRESSCHSAPQWQCTAGLNQPLAFVCFKRSCTLNDSVKTSGRLFSTSPILYHSKGLW